MTSTWQIWIDTGGTFTDGLARSPDGVLHRTKVLSSSRLRARIDGNGQLQAPWLTAPIFDGYKLRVIETSQEFRIRSLTVDGSLYLDVLPDGGVATSSTVTETTVDEPVTALIDCTVELYTSEEAPVLATRLLTQTPVDRPFPPLEMRLGTTKGTNALLERKGAHVALLVTRGFRDLLLIGTQQRPDLFQLAIPPAEVLYDTVLEVDERLSASGEVLTPLTPETLTQLIVQLRQQQPEAVAVSLLNAYRNPVHERQLAQALREAGFDVVTPGTDVSAQPQYVSRTQTAVVNAYLTPALRTYLTNVQQQLRQPDGRLAPVWVMTSAGGLVRADLFQPKDSLLSGPAGGVIGSAAVARQLAAQSPVRFTDTGYEQLFSRVLTFDMGGTSTDAARYDQQVDYRFKTRIGPFELQLPSLAIETVAAGGGSVCWFGQERLRVGPQSAGAQPGPACYGATPLDQTPLLTITDVNLLLGKLHPAQFGIPVFPERAEAALLAIQEQIFTETGQRPATTELLRGFEQIADEAMAGAIRKISVAQGFDPADYALLVFGGAGGLHGCAVAQLLGCQTLILPYDGGLLSAWGMGQASIERLAEQSVLQLLANTDVTTLVDELAHRALSELRRDVGTDRAVAVRSAQIFLRLQGQESSLPIAYPTSLITNWHEPSPATVTDLPARFQQQYQAIYGHFPANRPIEVENIRVIAATDTPSPTAKLAQPEYKPAQPAFQTGQYTAYDWTALSEGDQFNGPALLLNRTSSAFVEAGWQVSIQRDQNAVVRQLDKPDQSTAKHEFNTAVEDSFSQIDAIQLELFTRRFMAIAEEMGTQLQRTAFSTNVKERLDFSCALLDANAELVANAPHIPVHLGSLGVCARLCLQKLPLGPGDVIITNHPRYGGSHLPDVTLLQGVFTDVGELAGYVINRAHHAEIGGKVPGSMPPDATSLVEEGVVLEPQYVVRNGQFLWDNALENQFTDAPYPTRALAENRADIEAALASLRAGEAALLTLVRSHGLVTVQRYMNHLKASATTSISAVLIEHEGRVFQADESLDDGHTIRVKIAIRNGQLTVDFSGTSAVHPNNLNANLSILYSAVLYVLRLWCREDIPLNEGLMTPVRFILPESSFLNPVFPDDNRACPAVVGGNTEVSQRLVDTMLKALGLAACSYGTMNNFLFGRSGTPPEAFGYYETIGGGTGATPGANGRSAVHQHMTNTRLTDPEELERRYPVRLREFSIRAGSGGNGQWHGGDGIIREIEFLETVQATLLSQHRVVAPYGLDGGEPGLTGLQTLIHTDGSTEVLPGIFTRAMQAGERIRIETPGGGGANREEKDATPIV